MNEEYTVSDYGIFTSAIETTNQLNEKLETSKGDTADCKTRLGDDSIFMGPICDSCLEALDNVTNKITTLTSNFTKIESYLEETSSTYQKADSEATTTIISLDSATGLVGTNTVSTNNTPISSVAIPDNVSQSGYTVTCYGEGGWYLGGGSSPTSIAGGTNQKSVHEAWLADGARYKDGIAVMNVDGVDHYLVATAPTFGTVGDNVTVNLENGQTIPCVIADAKSTSDANYTPYGHSNGTSINVLEFEVDRNKYNSTGNPTTSTWGLSWDSSSDVSSIDNYGTVI